MLPEDNNKNLSQLATQIKLWGHELGIQQIGITDTNLKQAEANFNNWLEKNHHGEMAYLKNNSALRFQPQNLYANTKSIICCSIVYPPPLGYADNTIAAFALGRDYHKIVRQRLLRLAKKIAEVRSDFRYRVFCDSAPVAEKSLAAKAGLGWIGKNTLLINPQHGSFQVLGEIFTNLSLPKDEATIPNRCGTCHRCLSACPTGALIAPGVLDARRCIAYLTIEQRAEIAPDLASKTGNKIFGCDICQQVCPWNKFATKNFEGTFPPEFVTYACWQKVNINELQNWDEKTFLEKTRGSALRRVGYARWQRNLRNAIKT